jgi:outer membrane protein assembly factor BamB
MNKEGKYRAVGFSSGAFSPCNSTRLQAVMALLFLAIATPLLAGDWPSWRGPERNGISAETNLNWTWPDSGLKPVWKTAVGIGFSSLSTAGGRVFTLGNANDIDTVFCLEADSGREVWKHTYPSLKDPKAYEGGPLSTPTVDGDRVYTLGKFGDCFCFEAKTGKIIWSRKFDRPVRTKEDYGVWWGFAGSPVVVGEKLLMPVGTAGMAVDKLTGKPVWDNGPGYSGYSSPVLFQKGETAFAFVSGHEIVAGEVATGRILWKTPWKTTWDQNASDGVVSDGKLFVSTGHEVGCALYDISKGKPVELWRNKNMRTYLSSCVLWKGHLFGFDDRQMRCLDWKTGEVRWTAPDLGLGSLILADGKLIALTEKGMLLAVEATGESYKLLASARILEGRCWSAPALSNGRLFVRNAAGDALCLDLRK